MTDFMRARKGRAKVNVKYNHGIKNSCEDVVRASMQLYNYTHGTRASLHTAQPPASLPGQLNISATNNNSCREASLDAAGIYQSFSKLSMQIAFRNCFVHPC